jgi:ribosomal protein S18 acetylase RimI-like enzyme
MIGLSVSSQKNTRDMPPGGLHPVKLSRDLADLADLIELSFADAMDESGRAAIREMRALSKMGSGLDVLGRLNDLAAGISHGYVWIADGNLVGNVSVYPADWPSSMGPAWIIANVAVHPEYQRRGIARRLMQATLKMIEQRGGGRAILQVDYDNTGAIRLYESLGFIKERAFTTWWRSGMAAPPAHLNADVHITRRKRSEWKAERDLAERIRPDERGGLGWMKPIHKREFAPSWWQKLKNMLTLSGKERLIIRAEDGDSLRASLWVEKGLGPGRNRLTLLADPACHAPYAQALLNNVLRRFHSSGFVIEHPHDDRLTNDLLKAYRFHENRTVWHMRLTIPG